MTLSRPTNMVFVISLVIAAVAALTALGTISVVPVASVWLMAIAYTVLAAGCLFRGA